MSGRAWAMLRPLSPISCTKTATLVFVAVRALATDSVEGQRSRPSGVMRLDLLNEVGSRPAALARPEADRPARAASRSRAVHSCACVSIGSLASRDADLGPAIGIIAYLREARMFKNPTFRKSVSAPITAGVFSDAGGRLLRR